MTHSDERFPADSTLSADPNGAALGSDKKSDSLAAGGVAVSTVKSDLPGTDHVIVLEQTESVESRRHRITLGSLLVLLAALFGWLATKTSGEAAFALSDHFSAVQLPTIVVSGFNSVVICAVICLLAGAILISGRIKGKALVMVNLLAGLAVLVGFIAWAAAGRGLPFLVANQFNGTMNYATPLILGALAGVLGERSGVTNVAIEGQFLTAAFSAALVGTLTKSIVAAMVAGMLAGALIAAMLALFSIKYWVDQVVLGVVLNLFAAGLTGYLYSEFVATDATAYNAAPILSPIAVPYLSKIPFFGPILFNQTALVYLALAAVVLVWFLVYKTKWGLRVRSVGEHPQAADTVGINVRAVRWQALLVGGLLAGLGGTYFTICSTGQFVKGISAGNGFIALAALIMGRWHPAWAAVMAIFFGFVSQLASQVQALNTPVNSQFLLILPYVATVIAVAGLVGRVRAPAADGKNYMK